MVLLLDSKDNPEENKIKREEIAKRLTIEKENNRFTVKTIGQLIDGCLEYYSNKYVILAHRERIGDESVPFRKFSREKKAYQ